MKIFVTCLTLLLLVSPLLAQDYVGDATCATCHADNYANYMNSGHPYKITHTAGQVPADDTWPWTPVPPLPIVYDNQLTWGDVEYVIGNFFWKARFIDHQGYIYTGDVDETTQWNVQLQNWVPYHAGETEKPFDCGRCHTTGYDADGGNQNGLPGLIGTWTEDGVRCEACHGPGGDHITNPAGIPVPGGKACSDCHYRDEQFRMPWSGGFMRHHQQGEDLSHSPHANFECITCHTPHRSTVYNDGGIQEDFSCNNCHAGDEANSYYMVEGMESVECIDCHMPEMGKSAGSLPDNEYVGDIKGHLFRIKTDPITREENTVEIDGSTYWAQDDVDGNASATLDYVCLKCHLVDGMTLAEAADYAEDIHSNHPLSVSENTGSELPETFRIASVYPNPFNPTTQLRIELDRPYVVTLVVYDALGREVRTLKEGPTKAGTHDIQFDAGNLPSGIYFVRLKTGAGSAVEKIMLMK